MTRLVDLVQEMGLVYETSRSGRWVRVHAAQGSLCVVEAAWAGYYAFGEAKDGPSPELYLDPAAAIRAGLAQLRELPLAARGIQPLAVAHAGR